MMPNEEEQEDMWRKGWRPEGYVAPDGEEDLFRREHPGWLQAVWAHPSWPAWVAKRHGNTEPDGER